MALDFAAALGAANAFDGEALEELAARPWPGHVRELRAAVTRLIAGSLDRPIRATMIRALGRREVHDTPARIASLLQETGATSEDYERAGNLYIATTLEANNGNVSLVARKLAASREWLRKKLARRRAT